MAASVTRPALVAAMFPFGAVECVEEVDAEVEALLLPKDEFLVQRDVHQRHSVVAQGILGRVPQRSAGLLVTR